MFYIANRDVRRMSIFYTNRYTGEVVPFSLSSIGPSKQQHPLTGETTLAMLPNTNPVPSKPVIPNGADGVTLVPAFTSTGYGITNTFQVVPTEVLKQKAAAGMYPPTVPQPLRGLSSSYDSVVQSPNLIPGWEHNPQMREEEATFIDVSEPAGQLTDDYVSLVKVNADGGASALAQCSVPFVDYKYPRHHHIHETFDMLPKNTPVTQFQGAHNFSSGGQLYNHAMPRTAMWAASPVDFVVKQSVPDNYF